MSNKDVGGKRKVTSLSAFYWLVFLFIWLFILYLILQSVLKNINVFWNCVEPGQYPKIYVISMFAKIPSSILVLQVIIVIESHLLI